MYLQCSATIIITNINYYNIIMYVYDSNKNK